MSVAREANESPIDPQSPPLVSAGHSDRCPVCGAHLATDQRYCVECGTRRGAPRFSLASPATSATAGAAAAPAPQGGRFQRFMRPSSGSSLLLGLLIILVALGIGVLIGHNGNAKPTKQPVSVVVNGGGSSGATSAGTSGTAASTGGTAAAASTRSKTKIHKTASTPKKAVTKAAAATNPNAKATGKAGTAAAAKSFSTTATKKSTLGGSCTPGTAGCSNGKQTGNLF